MMVARRFRGVVARVGALLASGVFGNRLPPFLVLALAMDISAACSPPEVILPPTREAQACARDCIGIRNSCNSWSMGTRGCDKQLHDCRLTCPGAREEDPGAREEDTAGSAESTRMRLTVAGLPTPAAPSELLPPPGQIARPRAVAVVVGVEKYRRDLPPASGARADAELFAQHMETGFGLSRANIHLLIDSDATKSSIDAELEEWLPRNVSPSDDAFFFFAGHGAPDPQSGERYFVPWDADTKFIATQAIPVAKATQRLGALHAAHVFAFMDSCFSGAGGRSVLAPGTRPLVLQRTPLRIAVPKLALFSAAGPDEITGAAGAHGLFSSYLFRGLHGAADSNGDGAVTYGELVDYVVAHVPDDARRENRDQHPQASGASARDVVLTRARGK